MPGPVRRIRPTRAVATVLALALMLTAPLTLAGNAATVRAGDDRTPITVPSDAHKPAGTLIPVLWKVGPGVINFYSEQPDPVYTTGAYSVKAEGVRGSRSAHMYATAMFKLACGKKYLFTATSFEGDLYPEDYRIAIPCPPPSPVNGKVTKVASSRPKAKVAVFGTAAPAAKVKTVQVQLRRPGKVLTGWRTATGAGSWRVGLYPKSLPKGAYTAVIRIIPTTGTTRVLKKNFTVR